MTSLFDPITIKNLTCKNRIMMSPMCQYSVSREDGQPEEWHKVHYMSRAIGGTGLIMIEMTGVHPDGRITEKDLGLWSDEQLLSFQEMIAACQQYGAKVGIQIGHAGRKSQVTGRQPIAPSAIPFRSGDPVPHEMDLAEIQKMVEHFAKAAHRAVAAGVDVVELHGAHGYLIHQFMSRLSNQREDVYGEPEKFASEVIQAVKSEIPSDMPLFMRLSAVEYAEGGYTLEETIQRCHLFHQLGVDLFDISSGGESTVAPPPVRSGAPGYQVPYAAAIRKAVHVPVVAVGRLDDPFVAEMVVQNEQADMVAIGRGMLRNPYWSNEAALALGRKPILPKPYERAF